MIKHIINIQISILILALWFIWLPILPALDYLFPVWNKIWVIIYLLTKIGTSIFLIHLYQSYLEKDGILDGDIPIRKLEELKL